MQKEKLKQKSFYHVLTVAESGILFLVMTNMYQSKIKIKSSHTHPHSNICIKNEVVRKNFHCFHIISSLIWSQTCVFRLQIGISDMFSSSR